MKSNEQRTTKRPLIYFGRMIGDGVNDVLSLKKANMGIAMESGSTATRSVAAMILLDDSFEAMPAALNEGQRIVNSIQDMLKLYLVKVFAVLLIIIAIEVPELGFPFTPSQNTLLSFFATGVPPAILAFRPSSLKIFALVILAMGRCLLVGLGVLFALDVQGGELVQDRVVDARQHRTQDAGLGDLALEDHVRADRGGQRHGAAHGAVSALDAEVDELRGDVLLVAVGERGLEVVEQHDEVELARREGQLLEHQVAHGVEHGGLLALDLLVGEHAQALRAQDGDVPGVAAERLDEALTSIESESNRLPLTKNISSQDVTKDYTDLQSRLRNLEEAEAQLREIMASANKTEDVLSVYNQLVQVREQIEVTKGQIQYYEQSAALSAISVEILADEAVQPLTVGGWQPGGGGGLQACGRISPLRSRGLPRARPVFLSLPEGGSNDVSLTGRRDAFGATAGVGHYGDPCHRHRPQSAEAFAIAAAQHGGERTGGCAAAG